MTSLSKPALRPIAPGRQTGLVAAAKAIVTLWRTRRQSRRALLVLDDHLLRDIGLDAHRAHDEGIRPFWRD
ncbi:DUF1127 domain-containing protein [Frigidibacter sp. RF13]|uniref:DUF1127 domain-containing protein n=1 Tax=Frigidibacter sp. RF13 TaxID=2997340 RepID=UPI00226F28DD|nr:DUF1127 domain-containing protein [Frigidibacter sp. RF13]MCY1127937.1 DUF1127 domain-containing protein [Frigidibacter sp. RF13]